MTGAQEDVSRQTESQKNGTIHSELKSASYHRLSEGREGMHGGSVCCGKPNLQAQPGCTKNCKNGLTTAPTHRWQLTENARVSDRKKGIVGGLTVYETHTDQKQTINFSEKTTGYQQCVVYFHIKHTKLRAPQRQYHSRDVRVWAQRQQRPPQQQQLEGCGFTMKVVSTHYRVLLLEKTDNIIPGIRRPVRKLLWVCRSMSACVMPLSHRRSFRRRGRCQSNTQAMMQFYIMVVL